MSPLLFSIFINSITLHISSLYHLYADDLQIYSHAKLTDLPTSIDNLNNDLKNLYRWSSSYGLNINPSKCQVIIIGSPKLVCRIDWSLIPPVVYNHAVISYSDKVKNLGVIFDRHLSWAPQLSEMSRKLFAAIGSLRRLQYFLPLPTKITLAQSLLLPILDYADTCYLDLKEEQLNKLERLQNLCIRFIFGLRKYDHVSEFRNCLKWLPIRLRRDTHILSLLYCILFHPDTPLYLKERFNYLCDTHERTLRSESTLILETPAHTTSFYSNSFSVKAVQLWNDLPLPIKQAQSLSCFKKYLKAHYLSLNTS